MVLLKSAQAPVAVLLLPVVLLRARWRRWRCCCCRWCCCRERWTPLAVLSVPVVLLESALSAGGGVVVPVVLR